MWVCLSSRLRIRLTVKRIPQHLWQVLYLPQVGDLYQAAIRITHNEGCQQCLNKGQTLIRLDSEHWLLDWTSSVIDKLNKVWLQDYIEAMEDCRWDNQKRAKWFSWFLSGPAKATWQQTMSAEDKADWDKITEVYHGQYGIHLDPRTAYQCCHDLQYEQFSLVQGLLNAMREYQCMAPLKLKNKVFL